MSKNTPLLLRHRWRRRDQSSGCSAIRLSLLGLIGIAAATLFLVGFLGTAAGVAAVGVYSYFAKDLSDPEAIVNRTVAQTTKIYDRNGELLYELFDPRGGRRTWMPLDEVPRSLIEATIATEDANFYTNPGFNLRGILRAGLSNLQGNLQGGSSITQQLVKNVLIPEEERSKPLLSRKIKELILSYEITRRYTKDQILELYLNEIFYGNLSYGIEAAAQSYFGKSARDLTLAESALLAGLPQAPARYSPITNLAAAKERQATVLELMVSQGFITKAEAEAAKNEKMEFAQQHFPIQAPHFVVYVRELLERKYGTDFVYRGGLKVTTTLDLHLQEEAERIAKERIEQLKRQNANNAALVALRPQTGEILAMLGSVDYFNPEIDGQVNMAVAERQPGSSFKPFTYVTAFKKGFTPATLLLDVRTSFPDGINPPYVPENVDGKFSGPVSVRRALATSLNIPAVRTIQFAGVQNVIDMAHKFGITTLTRKNTYGLALTLGGGEVKLLDMVYGYAVFANGGTMAGVPIPPSERRPEMRTLDPVAILKIEAPDGRVIEEFREPQRQRIVEPQYAYLISNILSDNDARAVFFGPNNPLRLQGRPAAAKTGTTTDWRDNWTIGYTPDLVAGVWVGNADNTPMFRSFGSTAAAPIWKEFMETALADTPPRQFEVPDNIVTVTVCTPSGLLPNGHCPNTRQEVFVKGTEPKQQDNIYQVFKVDKATGKLATSATPPANIEERVYMVLPPEAADWARENNVAQPPREYGSGPTNGPAITAPLPGSSVAKSVQIRGTARTNEFRRYLLEFGEGLTPTAWKPIGGPSDNPVQDGVLGTWDTTGLNGLFTLRLTLFRGNNQNTVVTTPLTVDNTPPTVAVVYPYNGSTLILDRASGSDVGIQAAVKDNGVVDKVEFFVDDQPIGMTTVVPYNRAWRFSGGEHIFHAVAYDEAGNSAKSEPVKAIIRFK